MAAEPSLSDLAGEARLPRNLVLADREGASAEDLRDCAALLMKSGSDAAAELLLNAATFSVGAPPGAAVERSGSTWDIAVGELSDLLAVAEEEGSSFEEQVMRLALAEADDEPYAAPPPPDAAWLTGEFGQALIKLLGLRNAGPTTSTGEWDGLIEIAFRHGPIDLAAAHQAPADLATALAFNVVRRVLIHRSEFAKGPYGGTALFARAERLTARGLGLGLRNLSFVAPTRLDIELLITEAWCRASRRRDLASTIDRFAVLLSIGLSGAAQRVLVDAFADAGRTQVLIGILVRLQRAPVDRVDTDLLRTLRDGLIDLGRLPLGAAAQTRLTVVMGGQPAETVARDELEASLQRQGAVVRLSGFGSSALQRRRRFHHAADRKMEDQNSLPP